MRLFAAILVAIGLSTSILSAEPCRLALAMALDVSGSVDEVEYRLQMEGVATALADPDVQAVLFAMPGTPVAMAVFEWSSSSYQRVIQDWVLISDKAALAALVSRLHGWEREPAPEATGLGAAMEFGKAIIDRAPPCWDQTLDVSGDGKNNDWPTPRDLRRRGVMGDLRINALVIVKPESDGTSLALEPGELPAYFRARVIQGPDAFVEVAQGFQDYARAMKRKLLKELATRPLGALGKIPRRF